MKYKQYYRHFRHWLSFPFIWLVLIPLLFLDIALEIYHRICFPLYGLKYVNRSQYLKIDRYKLGYLPWWDRINCLYCEYANGLLPYSARIAAETEKYWCGIKHQPSKEFIEPAHHNSFLKYDDAKAFEKQCKLSKKK